MAIIFPISYLCQNTHLKIPKMDRWYNTYSIRLVLISIFFKKIQVDTQKQVRVNYKFIF